MTGTVCAMFPSKLNLFGELKINGMFVSGKINIWRKLKLHKALNDKSSKPCVTEHFNLQGIGHSTVYNQTVSTYASA